MRSTSRTFDVADMVADVAATVEALVDEEGQPASRRPSPRMSARMHADVTKLRQCLFNLLSNAAKFTENGRSPSRSRREADGDVWLTFAVTDTGIGMTAEQVGRLFERFTQADASTTRRYGGTGLGLAISRAFAHMLGGDIAVASREGEGTTFTLRLPAPTPPGRPRARRPAQAAEAGGAEHRSSSTTMRRPATSSPASSNATASGSRPRATAAWGWSGPGPCARAPSSSTSPCPTWTAGRSCGRSGPILSSGRRRS